MTPIGYFSVITFVRITPFPIIADFTVIISYQSEFFLRRSNRERQNNSDTEYKTVLKLVLYKIDYHILLFILCFETH